MPKVVFLERVRDYLAESHVSFEQRRRARLEQARRLEFSYRSQLVKVVEDRPAEALALLSSCFASLPAGVELTPHTLHIEFRGREEFLN